MKKTKMAAGEGVNRQFAQNIWLLMIWELLQGLTMTTEGASFILWFFFTLPPRQRFSWIYDKCHSVRVFFFIYIFNVLRHKGICRVHYSIEITHTHKMRKQLGAICSLNPFPSTDINEELLGDILPYHLEMFVEFFICCLSPHGWWTSPRGA